MNRYLLVMALLVVYAMADCTVLDKLSHLESGSVSFSISVNDRGPTKEFVNNFGTAFAKAPFVACSLHSFAVSSYDIGKWFIAASSITQSKVTFSFHFGLHKWNSVAVGFWASSRPDITLGASAAQFASLKNKAASVIVNTTSQILNSKSALVRVFLTGFDMKSGSQWKIRVFSGGVTSTQIMLKAETGNMEVSFIQFNYLVFSHTTVQFASYGNFITKADFQKTQQFDIKKANVHDSPYRFYGFIALVVKKPASIQLSAVMTDSFYLQIAAETLIDQFIFSYIIIGQPPADSCSGCQKSYIANGQCVSQCPDGTYLTQYTGRQACRSCPTDFNMINNAQKNDCTCGPNSEQIDGICVAKQPQVPLFDNFQEFPQFETPFGDSTFGGSSFGDSSFGSSNFGSTPPIPVPNQKKEPILGTPLISAPPVTTSSVRGPQVISPVIVPNSVSPVVPVPPVSTQSYQPQIPSVPPQIPNPPPIPNIPNPQYPTRQTSGIPNNGGSYKNQDCPQPNTYWTGYRCACKWGYRLESGNCVQFVLQLKEDIFKPSQFINKISLMYTQTSPVCPSFETYNGNMCVCIEGYTRDLTQLCVPISEQITCPPNSHQDTLKSCVCNDGFVRKGDLCESKSKPGCPQNSYDNGFGECICKKGFYKNQGVCVMGEACPPYSERDSHQNCKCIAGYQKFGKFCSRCPQGQVWLQQSQSCVTTCGVNQQVGPQGKCECKIGYGFYEGICNHCPAGFFLKDSYCVTCPIGASFDNQNSCLCKIGFNLSASGFCQERCLHKPNQYYDEKTKSCRCLDGLGRVQGTCQVCTGGSIEPGTQNCRTGCPPNMILQGSRCVCSQGYGLDQNKVCVKCNSKGGFLIDGFCAYCPSGQTYLGGECICPHGETLINNKCSAPCPSHQRFLNGCYSCPLNQMFVNDICQCRVGYQRIGQYCQLSCKPDQFIIRGRCAQCALNTQFDPLLGACVCPAGQYMNSFGICTEVSLTPITCNPGQYLDDERGCLSCPSGCSECSSYNYCTSCSTAGYQPRGGVCATVCGDGIMVGNQACDDGNKVNGDGCSSKCQIEATPICGDKKINAPGEMCDDGNNSPGDGCYQCRIENGWICPNNICKVKPGPPAEKGLEVVGEPYLNFNNVFVSLKTPKQYTFNSQSQMKQFMKYDFEDEDTQPASAYCMQKGNDKSVFECLLVYTSGLPNIKFSVHFSYNYKGDQGEKTVEINPLKSKFQNRSLKRRP